MKRQGRSLEYHTGRECVLVFQTAMSYIGAIVGAGFASGRELLTFFGVYGRHGFYGVILSAALLGVLPLGVAHLFRRNPAPGQGSPRLPIAFYRYYLRAYLFGGLCVMLSGSRMVFGNYLGSSPESGGMVMAIALALTVLGRTEVFLKVNGILVPFLVLLTAYVCIAALVRSALQPPAVSTLLDASKQWTFLPASWVASSLLYVSYNLPLGAAVLVAVGGPRYRLMRSTLLAVACLGFLMLLFVAAVLDQTPDIAAEESPMLHMAGERHNLLRSVYAGALWVAMFTTALAETLGLVDDLATNARVGHAGATVLVLGAAYPLSRYGFSKMVSSVYPMLGYLGLPLTGLVAVYTILDLYRLHTIDSSRRREAFSEARPRRHSCQP